MQVLRAKRTLVGMGKGVDWGGVSGIVVYGRSSFSFFFF